MKAIAWRALLAGALAWPAVGLALETGLGEFADLEKSGAVIGEVRVHTRNIFDSNHPAENWGLYALANRLHGVTRPAVIEHMLLFRSGEPVSVQKINETDRLLRTLRIIHDVEFRPSGYDGRKVDIDVTTRDTWSLDLTGSFSRAGGSNKSRFGFRERNLLGTGLAVGVASSSDVDRHGTELGIAYDQAFDGWTRIAYNGGHYNDGRRNSILVDRPFYSFDTRSAYRAAWSDEDRIDAIYNAGETVGEYRHRLKIADLSAGWSPGLANGWTRRYSTGLSLRDDAYRREPGRALDLPLPVDHQVRAPFVRFELLEDDFLRVTNHNRIHRPEFLELGFSSYVQVSRALPALGSTRADWLYAAGASDGTTLPGGQTVIGQATVERRIGSTATALTQAGLLLRTYAPRGGASLYYASLSADVVRGGGVADELLLGGALGLRGYPLRYQSGVRRVLASLEKRVYSDWYPLRLVRVGGAAFIDCGRAWGGSNGNAVNGGWLTDVGAGLRIALDRAAFDNVLHLDVAAPLNRAPGVKKVQFIVKTEFAF